MKAPILLKGKKNPRRITQAEAIQQLQQMAGAAAAMRQHIKGQELVLAVLLDRAGGEVKITQAEMTDTAGWAIRQGFNPGVEGSPSSGFWVFKLELTEEQKQAKRFAAMSPEEYDAFVRAVAKEKGDAEMAAAPAGEGA